MARGRRRVSLNPNSRKCLAAIGRYHNSKRAAASNKPSTDSGKAVIRPPYEPFASTLKAIGFSSYAEYLASGMWAQVRNQAFAQWGKRCRACNGQATQLHHADYSRATLEGKTLKYLWPVCNVCHQRAHDETSSVSEATGWIRTAWQNRVRAG